MAKEPSTMQKTRFYTKAFGKITESTAKALNTTPWMNQISRVHFAKVKNKDLARKSGQMAAHTVVTGA